MRAYLQGLVMELAARGAHHEFVLFTPVWADPLLEHLPPNVEVVPVRGVPRGRNQRVLHQQTLLPVSLARHDLDVFFATATIAPLFCPAPVVLAVQFTQFYCWPEAYGRIRTAYLKFMLPLSLRKARRAIIFTESAKADLVRWARVSPEKVAVVPHALPAGLRHAVGRLQEQPWPGRALTGGHPYILYVSATYGYKNHDRLIRAFGLLQRWLGTSHRLLLVGEQVTVSFDSLRDTARRAGVEDRVVFAGRLDPYERVIAAYAGADLAVAPSLYETFGYPVLEAMACGSPLVTSNYGSMAEVAGGAAILVDPLDAEAMASGMAQVLTDGALRDRLVRQARDRAGAFTWDRSARATLEILEEAAGG